MPSSPTRQKKNPAHGISPNSEGSRRRTLRAKAGKVVTQLAYARAGSYTPEMDFIAIRENLGFQISNSDSDFSGDNTRNDLSKQHEGSSQSAIPQSDIRIHASIFRRFRKESGGNTPEFSGQRWRRDHGSISPRTSITELEPMIIGAAISREDQRQHRQQRRRVEHRGGGRENAMRATKWSADNRRWIYPTG